MNTKIVSGINVQEFNFRKAKEALAQCIHYSRASAFGLDVPHWLGLTHEQREQDRDLAEATLRLELPAPVATPPTVGDGSYFALAVHSARSFATGMRGTHGPVIGAISPSETVQS